jgi:hypothetical membrane protein
MMLKFDRSPEWYRNIAGVMLFLAGVITFMGIITAETLYPGYHTGENMISDLGGSEPPNSVIMQPAATIFNATMMTIGALFIIGALLLHRSGVRRSVTVPVLLLGVGALGVGVFPGNTGTVHALFALLTFFSGGLSAILSSRVLGPPLKYISIILGAIGLSALLMIVFLGDSSPLASLGDGGAERWVAYPIILWAIGFGGYSMGNEAKSEGQI